MSFLRSTSSTVKNSMNDRPFIDTNILVYAFATVKGAPPDSRTLRAHEIVTRGGVISVQVLNEFVQVCRRKARLDWNHVTQALDAIKSLFEPVVPITIQTHESAVQLAHRHDLNIYDALIVAAAREAGCDILYSEDLQHGQTIGKVKIVNPFL